MAERVKQLTPGPIVARMNPDTPDSEAGGFVEEWTPEDPTEQWTDWTPVGEEVDNDPTYYPEYKRVSLFQVAIKRLAPWRHRTVTRERRLIRRWVDAEQGPMAEVVKVEREQVRV